MSNEENKPLKKTRLNKDSVEMLSSVHNTNPNSKRRQVDSLLISDERQIETEKEEEVDQLPGIVGSRQSMFNSITDVKVAMTRNNTRSNSMHILEHPLNVTGFR